MINEKTITAIMPIKLNNERCPGKNTRLLGGKPLLQYELDSLLATRLCSDINVFCSSEDVIPFLPEGVTFIQRPQFLDLPTSNFTQIFSRFISIKDADIYVFAHATAPFVTIETMKECINAVLSERYDSAFCAVKLQDFLWKNGKPLNFDATNIPRTQDLEPIYQETSGIYVFTKDVFLKYKRRIGINPYIKEVSFKEAVDIDTLEDFKIAEFLLNME